MKRRIMMLAAAVAMCAPLAGRADGLFCVFPEFWFWDSGFAVLPFGAKYDFSGGTLFPVWWWNNGKNYKLHSLFPAYYYHRSGEKTTFWAGCGLGGWRDELGDSRHWLFPLYLKTRDSFLSIPYSRVRSKRGGHEDRFLLGLAGATWGGKDNVRSSWAFPFYYEDSTGFLAILGFTYDAKTDGYSKTSFLWRLYRYEKDAKGNKKLDLLFLPILR